MAVNLTPVQAISRVAHPLIGLPACIAGSAVAAEAHGLPLSDSSDVDVFCYSEQALIAASQRLLSAGFDFSPRFERVWERWMQYGLRNWHTNSMKFVDPNGVEINVVHKLLGGHPTSSLAQVLESFDFGLLAVGYDLTQVDARSVAGVQFRDLRSFLFPGWNISGPLPLMPNKRADWRRGLISQYNGLREAGRYAKYSGYGYDLSMVKDDLIEGYMAAALYLGDRDKPEKKQLGLIYQTIAEHIDLDHIDELVEASKLIIYTDDLDAIMEALE